MSIRSLNYLNINMMDNGDHWRKYRHKVPLLSMLTKRPLILRSIKSTRSSVFYYKLITSGYKNLDKRPRFSFIHSSFLFFSELIANLETRENVEFVSVLLCKRYKKMN